MVRKSLTRLDPALLGPAVADSFRKLAPAVQGRNPVMFVVYIGSILTSVLFLQALRGQGEASAGFIFGISAWLWFTVLFANFAEAVAEGRGKAQAESLKKTRTDSQAKLLKGAGRDFTMVSGTSLKVGDIVLVEAGEPIPSDGELVEGIASVD